MSADKRIVSRVLAGILAWQLAVGPLVASMPKAFAITEGDDVSSDSLSELVASGTEMLEGDSAEKRNLLNASAQAIEAGNGKSLPGPIPDVFHLTNQVTKAFTKKDGILSFELAALEATPPSIVAPDFDRDVQIEADPVNRTLNLNLVVDGNLKAQHMIRGFAPVAYARDREFLVFLEQSGKLYAIDMGYAKSEAFRTPLPVVELVNAGIPAERMKGLKASFLSRGLKPLKPGAVREGAIMPLDKDVRLTAGDFVLYSNQNGERVIEGLFDRTVISTQMMTAEATLATLAFSVAPSTEAEEMLKQISTLQGTPEGREAVAKTSEAMPSAEKAALARMSPEAIAALIARSKRNQAGKGEQRDRFELDEWERHFRQLHEQAVTELQKTSPEYSGVEMEQLKNWKALQADIVAKNTPLTVVHKGMGSKAMKIIAAITAGTAVATAHFGAQETLTFATYYLNTAYQNYWPEVLKDASYRVTLLKSSLALGAFVPLVWGLGKYIGIRKGNTWDPWKNIAAGGMRIYAAIVLPFHHRIAQLLRQPNFIRALQLGINPLVRVSPDSSVGKASGIEKPTRPGLVNPLQGRQKFREATAQKEVVLKALADQKARVNSLTWNMALLVASGKTSVDPATLALLMSQGKAFDLDSLEKLAKDPKFVKRWSDIAEELQFTLRKTEAFGQAADVEQVNPEELARYYQTAIEVSRKLVKRRGAAAFLQQMRTQWSRLPEKFLRTLGNFSVEEYKFLKGTEPSQRDVVSQFSKQFQLDYSLAVVQMGLIGERAHLNNPSALAADETRLLWTNPGHRTDMLDQVRIYGINAPSALALVYQRTSAVRDGSYDPVEQESLKGVKTSESFVKGIWEWTKGAANISQANYGGLWKKDLIKRFRTIQSGFLMVVGARLIFSGQSPYEAIAAFAFTMIWANWQFGWIWTPINRGNQSYQDRLERIGTEFAQAKSKLGSGLRLESSNEWYEGTKELLEIYRRAGAEVPSGIAASAEEALSLIEKVQPEALEALQNEVRAATETTGKLKDALLSGNVSQIEEARAALEALYLNSIPAATHEGKLTREAITHLNAISLLEHALTSPPYAVNPHRGVEWSTIWTGAIVTTYLATSLSVLTFAENNDWGHLLSYYGALSTALYAAAFKGQDFANWVVKGDNWRRFTRTATAATALTVLVAAQSGVAEAKEISPAGPRETRPIAVELRKPQELQPRRVQQSLLIDCESLF